MANELQFERPLSELKAKIMEVNEMMEASGVDLTEEVAHLEDKLEEQSRELYRSLTPWQRVQLARQPGRPTTLDYARGMCSDFLELHGDRGFRDDPAIVGGIGVLGGRPVTIVGNQKGRDTKDNIYRNFGMGYPEGYRKALRLMKEAEKFHRPVIVLIDTAGAYPGAAGEERGQSEAIARNLREMAGLRTPTVSVVTGEGGSGGALGLGVTDRIFMLQYAWYSVISPESAAAILWKDASLGPRAAETMKIGADDLTQLGIIDGIVEEPVGGAQKDPQAMIGALQQTVTQTLDELCRLPIDDLLQARYDKYRIMGTFQER